jgi:glycosyltransferase involved in cell wall biosynthesis
MALEAGARPDRIVDVPNAVDLSAVHSALGDSHIPDRLPPIVGWIGSFGEFHGVEVLIRAIPQMAPFINVVMVGDGPERPASQMLAQDLGVSDRVTWTGQLPHVDALRELAACGILASPHVPLRGGQPFFGSPTKIFEYMALARPIVASKLGQIGDVLEDGRTARLVTPGDSGELAAAIMELLSDQSLARRMGAAARQEVAAHHTWDRRAAAILTSFEG